MITISLIAVVVVAFISVELAYYRTYGLAKCDACGGRCSPYELYRSKKSGRKLCFGCWSLGL